MHMLSCEKPSLKPIIKQFYTLQGTTVSGRQARGGGGGRGG